MLERELTYQMPYDRLAKLGRLASRKAFARSWWLFLLLLAVYFVALAASIIFAKPLAERMLQFGLPDELPIVAVIGLFIIGFLLLQRYGRRQVQQRVDFDSAVRFRQEADGLRFATSEIEYFVRWSGISQVMLIEKEGVMFSHGTLFFLVPNAVFADAAERNGLARDDYGRLDDAARERSKKFMRPVLKASHGTAGA